MDVDWQWVAAPAISDELIARARSAAKADPARPELWIALANLLTLLHDNRGALDALLQGIGNAPDDPNLHFLAAQRLRALGEYEQALDECRHALRLKPDHSGARSMRFDLLAKTGRAGEASEEPVAPDSGGLEYLASRLGEDGIAAELLEVCDAALQRKPPLTDAVYYKALALAKLGKTDEARETLSVERHVAVSSMPAPDGHESAESFRSALAEAILSHPSLRPDPRGKSTEGGRQTDRIHEEDGPIFSVLFGMIREAVEKYVADHEEGDDAFTRSCPSRCSLQLWAVALGFGGHQQSHRHPDGWLSGVYYVQGPKDEDGGRSSGDLLLGEIGTGLGIDPPWGVRHIEPVPGRLVLFPSYLPHATEASQGSGERISVAFDVVPLS